MLNASGYHAHATSTLLIDSIEYLKQVQFMI